MRGTCVGPRRGRGAQGPTSSSVAECPEEGLSVIAPRTATQCSGLHSALATRGRSSRFPAESSPSLPEHPPLREPTLPRGRIPGPEHRARRQGAGVRDGHCVCLSQGPGAAGSGLGRSQGASPGQLPRQPLFLQTPVPPAPACATSPLRASVSPRAGGCSVAMRPGPWSSRRPRGQVWVLGPPGACGS